MVSGSIGSICRAVSLDAAAVALSGGCDLREEGQNKANPLETVPSWLVLSGRLRAPSAGPGLSDHQRWRTLAAGRVPTAKVPGPYRRSLLAAHHDPSGGMHGTSAPDDLVCLSYA